MILRGGWLLGALGLVLAVAAAGWGIVAFRRMRFRGTGDAPGVVEVVEGQIGYFGPTFGGFVALSDLVELRLVDQSGSRYWRLRTADGQALIVPLMALGAEKLFDAFAALPGLHGDVLMRALEDDPGDKPVWRREGPALAQPQGRHHESS
jgi:hypothetical protein